MRVLPTESQASPGVARSYGVGRSVSTSPTVVRLLAMHVLFFGTYDASVHPRVAVLRDGLADSGASVSECNIPLSLSTAQRVAILKNPARLPWLAWRLLVCWTGLVRRSRAWRRTGARPDAVV